VIEISKLPQEGLRLEGASERIQLEEDEALRELSWKLFLMPSGNQDVYFDIQAEAVHEGVCCKCLVPMDAQVSLRAQFLGSSDPLLVARGSYTLGTQDLDVVYLPEGALDEEALVTEQFLLQKTMRELCREDCKGLCPQCGKNLNKGQCGCHPEYAQPVGALARALAGIKIGG
jgi:uncharacterized protein